MRFANLTCLGTVTSTNDILFRSSFEDYPLDSALLAEEQTAGRGRAERAWESGPGGMYLSVLWKPERVEGLAFLGAYSLLEMCRREWGLEPKIRWPNDLVIEGRKLAGVLPQVKFLGSQLERVVLGVGLNVNQSLSSFSSSLKDEVTTLAQHLSSVPDMEQIARTYLSYFERELKRFETEEASAIYQRCEEHLEGWQQDLVACLTHRDEPERALGQLAALTSRGELRFVGGEILAHMGPLERLRFRAPLSPTSGH